MNAIKEPTTEIWGHDVTPRVDIYVKPDGWAYGERLIEGDSFSTFRIGLNSNGPIESLAVEIEVTGRTLRTMWGIRMVRVKITFVGDCEPDVVVRGYMEVPWR